VRSVIKIAPRAHLEKKMITLNRVTRITLTTVFAALLFSAAGSAMAESKFAQNHPRRHQVNHRLGNQNRRVHNQVASGKMSHSEARNIHAEDHSIRQEERADASKDGGHITKAEQHGLNQQENGVSHQIGQ
jgi:hypothetical protein